MSGGDTASCLEDLRATSCPCSSVLAKPLLKEELGLDDQELGLDKPPKRQQCIPTPARAGGYIIKFRYTYVVYMCGFLKGFVSFDAVVTQVASSLPKE